MTLGHRQLFFLVCGWMCQKKTLGIIDSWTFLCLLWLCSPSRFMRYLCFKEIAVYTMTSIKKLHRNHLLNDATNKGKLTRVGFSTIDLLVITDLFFYISIDLYNSRTCRWCWLTNTFSKWVGYQSQFLLLVYGFGLGNCDIWSIMNYLVYFESNR